MRNPSNKCIILTDFINTDTDKLINSLSKQNINTTLVLYLYASDFVLQNKIESASIDSSYASSLNSSVSNWADTISSEWLYDIKDFIKQYNVPKFLQTSLKCKLIELIKFSISFKSTIKAHCPDRIITDNFKSLLSEHIPLLTSIPVLKNNPRKSSFMERIRNKTLDILYTYFLNPRNYFFAFLLKYFLKKTSILIVGKNKSGNLHNQLKNKGYHIVTLGAAPRFDQLFNSDEFIKMDRFNNHDHVFYSKLKKYSFDDIELTESIKTLLNSYVHVIKQSKWLNCFLESRAQWSFCFYC